ncbi:U3 small nucleolar RNA-associated protein [Nymphaea thermarum]|nr:U3 small nucleolar RNA-associated protein [Nymphaea thermarum]
MGDVVQYKLERMVDELEDLEKKGLFTRQEIRHIVRKRRDFEYRLKRPSPLKQDFIAYINYETQLDALRKLRKKAIIRASEGTEKKWKKSVSDTASVIKILEIYKRAVTRFKGDIGLWFRYLEFCKERRHGRMKRALAEALRFHPNVPGLWIYAASWEFDHNLNVPAARALMQSGLRACPQSEDLWVEYLRMELTYLNKLKARKIALVKDQGVIGEVGVDDQKTWKDENEDLFVPLNDEKLAPANIDGKELNSDNELHVLQTHGSELFRAIYNEAIEATVSSMSLHKRFLEILDAADLLLHDEIKKEIMGKMHERFSREENYWDWLARMQISKDGKMDNSGNAFLSQLKKAEEVYEEALSVVPSAKMFSLYARFWSNIIAPEEDESEKLYFNSIPFDVMEFVPNLLRVYERACSSDCITEDLAKHYVSLHLKVGRLEEGRKLISKLCRAVPNSTCLSILRFTIEIKYAMSSSASISKDELQSMYDLLCGILTEGKISEAESLWLMGFKYLSIEKSYFDKLVQTFLAQLAAGGSVDSTGVISSTILDSVLQTSGTHHFRETYKRILALPHPSLATYKQCIEIESNLAYVGEAEALANVRNLFESALGFYGENIELWRNYYSFEIKIGTSSEASAIFWRARKILKNEADLLVTCRT